MYSAPRLATCMPCVQPRSGSARTQRSHRAQGPKHTRNPHHTPNTNVNGQDTNKGTPRPNQTNSTQTPPRTPTTTRHATKKHARTPARTHTHTHAQATQKNLPYAQQCKVKHTNHGLKRTLILTFTKNERHPKVPPSGIKYTTPPHMRGQISPPLNQMLSRTALTAGTNRSPGYQSLLASSDPPPKFCMSCVLPSARVAPRSSQMYASDRFGAVHRRCLDTRWSMLTAER